MDGMTEPAGETIETARLRRSPRYGVFLAAGAGLGVLAALILTFVFDGTADESSTGVVYSTGQVFGFLALYSIPIGVALAGTVALILDRVIGKRSKTVQISHQHVHTADAPGTDPRA